MLYRTQMNPYTALSMGWTTANMATGGGLNKFVFKKGVGLLGKGMRKVGLGGVVDWVSDTADQFSNEVLDSKDKKQASIQKNISSVTKELKNTNSNGYSNDPTNMPYSTDPNSNGIVHKKFDATKVKVDRRYL